MPDRPRRRRAALSRADLPDRFTPDTVRRLDMATVRRLADPRNGVLDADEQQAFNQALRVVMADTSHRLGRSLDRTRGGGPAGLDPGLARSYDRVEKRLAALAERTRTALPQFTDDWDPSVPPPGAPDTTPPPPDHDGDTDPGTETDDGGGSLGSLESDIESTSDTLEILERIASIEQQQLEHHQSQILRDVRGVFFALIVSVAVIIAGVAPMVEAEPDDRRLILLWTLGICVVAGLVYAAIRMTQSRGQPD